MAKSRSQPDLPHRNPPSPVSCERTIRPCRSKRSSRDLVQGAHATTRSPVRPVARPPALDRRDPQEPSDRTASRHRTSPLEVPIRQDRLMHFIDNAHIAATYAVSNVEPVAVTSRTGRRFQRRPTPLAVGLLLVPFATAAIAMFAHYWPGVGARAANETGTRPISIALGNASVWSPTHAPAIGEATPAETPGVSGQKAPVASAHGQAPTSAGVSARRPSSTSTADPADDHNGSTVRSVPCTAAIVAIGLCTPVAQISDRQARD